MIERSTDLGDSLIHGGKQKETIGETIEDVDVDSNADWLQRRRGGSGCLAKRELEDISEGAEKQASRQKEKKNKKVEL